MESEHLTDQAIDSVCKVSTKEWESWKEVHMRHGPQYIAGKLVSLEYVLTQTVQTYGLYRESNVDPGED